MSLVHVWTPGRSLDAKQSQELGELCCGLSATFCVVVDAAIRDLDEQWPESYAAALLGLSPFHRRATTTKAWPGSTSVDRVERLEHEVKEGLASAIGSVGLPLTQWEYPLAPDDPHFLRRDGSTLLGSCPSEDALWLELRDFEETAAVVERLERLGFPRER